MSQKCDKKILKKCDKPARRVLSSFFFLFSHFFLNLANPNFYFKSRNCFLAESTNRHKEKIFFFSSRKISFWDGLFKWPWKCGRKIDCPPRSVQVMVPRTRPISFFRPVQIMNQKDRPLRTVCSGQGSFTDRVRPNENKKTGYADCGDCALRPVQGHSKPCFAFQSL